MLQKGGTKVASSASPRTLGAGLLDIEAAIEARARGRSQGRHRRRDDARRSRGERPAARARQGRSRSSASPAATSSRSRTRRPGRRRSRRRPRATRPPRHRVVPRARDRLQPRQLPRQRDAERVGGLRADGRPSSFVETRRVLGRREARAGAAHAGRSTASRLEPRGALDRAQALASRLRAERDARLAVRDAAAARLAHRLAAYHHLLRADLPSGTVTFLFTDVEGSTRLLQELGADAYAEALAEHRRTIREACAAEGGAEVDTQGDAFFFAFPTAPGAISAASAMTEALDRGRSACEPACTRARRC